jgi:hypothetical protein
LREWNRSDRDSSGRVPLYVVIQTDVERDGSRAGEHRKGEDGIGRVLGITDGVTAGACSSLGMSTVPEDDTVGLYRGRFEVSAWRKKKGLTVIVGAFPVLNHEI